MIDPDYAFSKLRFAGLIFLGLIVLFIIGISLYGFFSLVLNTSDSDQEEITNESTPISVGATNTIELRNIRYSKGDGDIILIEYTDLECSYCKTFHPIAQEIAAEYSSQIKYSVKHFPLNVHPKAKREAVAAECAGQQGVFFEYVNAIFDVTPSNNQLEDSELFKAAEELQLDMNEFTQCVEQEESLPSVAEDAIEATATGGTGTPHIIIVDSNGTVLSRIRGLVTAEELRAEIDAALEE